MDNVLGHFRHLEPPLIAGFLVYSWSELGSDRYKKCLFPRLDPLISFVPRGNVKRGKVKDEFVTRMSLHRDLPGDD